MDLHPAGDSHGSPPRLLGGHTAPHTQSRALRMHTPRWLFARATAGCGSQGDDQKKTPEIEVVGPTCRPETKTPVFLLWKKDSSSSSIAHCRTMGSSLFFSRGRKSKKISLVYGQIHPKGFSFFSLDVSFLNSSVTLLLVVAYGHPTTSRSFSRSSLWQIEKLLTAQAGCDVTYATDPAVRDSHKSQKRESDRVRRRIRSLAVPAPPGRWSRRHASRQTQTHTHGSIPTRASHV